jgi:predicted membrane protein
MKENNGQSLMLKLFLGGALLLLGTAALASNFVQFNVWDLIGKWWPSFVIVYGLAQIISQPRTFVGSGLVIAFGVFAQLYTLNIVSVNPFSLIFPLIMIFVGLRIVFNSTFGRPKEEYKANFFNSTAIFGASDIVSSSNEFEGGFINSLFGGSKIDLRKATMSEKGASIDINVAFGGAEILVPKDWQVRFDTIPVFGGWSNKAEGTTGPILSVKGLIFCGGAEVKIIDDGK